MSKTYTPGPEADAIIDRQVATAKFATGEGAAYAAGEYTTYSSGDRLTRDIIERAEARSKMKA
jgi:membrane-bound inhibitor of C-type lysozyme